MPERTVTAADTRKLNVIGSLQGVLMQQQFNLIQQQREQGTVTLSTKDAGLRSAMALIIEGGKESGERPAQTVEHIMNAIMMMTNPILGD